MGTLRVGLVGARRGSGLVAPFELFPETRIAALCDTDPAMLADAGEAFDVPKEARYTDYDEFLQGPVDIAVIATPMPFHVSQSVKAMEAGKHVLSEVTAADKLEDCVTLVEAVKRTGRPKRWREHVLLRVIRQEGDDRRWQAGRYLLRRGRVRPRGRLVNPDRGAVLARTRPPIHYCTHSLGPLLMLMEDRITQACCLNTGYNIMPPLGKGCVDMQVALFRTEKGAVIKLLRSSVCAREPGMHYFVLYGTKGSVENSRDGGWKDEKGKLYIEGEMDRQAGWQEIDCPHSDPAAPPEAHRGGHGACEYYLVRDFIDALISGQRTPTDVVRYMDFTCRASVPKSDQQGGQWVDAAFRVVMMSTTSETIARGFSSAIH
jgi:predicted dehydrogenase